MTPGCGHGGPVAGRVCPHLLADPSGDHVRRFTGAGTAFDLVCSACSTADGGHEPQPVCDECHRKVIEESSWEGVAGTPEVRERAAGYTFAHETVGPVRLDQPVLDIQPFPRLDRQWWAAVDGGGRVLRLDLDEGTAEVLATLPEGAVALSSRERVGLHLSPDGRFAAVVVDHGEVGTVLDLNTGRVTLELTRGDYHSEQTPFPVAFFEIDGRTLVIHGTAWNRLDVSDAATGELLTARELPGSGTNGQPRPEHDLDYFHGGLAVSPNGQWVADNGWVWHPFGVPSSWSARRWVQENVWESEDGPTRRDLAGRVWHWHSPLCWVGDHRLAVWGCGRDADWLIPAVRVFDVTDGRETHWFPGPKGELAFDGDLFSFDAEAGTAVWDVDTGDRLHHEARFCPTRYHPGAKTFLTPLDGGHYRVSRLVRPTGAGFRGEPVVSLARTIRAGRRFDLLPVLADALEEVGCSDAAVLGHCRTPGPHGGRCWVVDRVLGDPAV